MRSISSRCYSTKALLAILIVGERHHNCRVAASVAIVSSPAPHTAALTPLQAIRKKCLWCCIGSAHEGALCPAKACPSWPFRFGHKPNDELIAEQGDTPLYPLEWRMTAAAFHARRHSPLKA